MTQNVTLLYYNLSMDTQTVNEYLLISLIILNILVSISVLKDKLSSKYEKTAKLLILWLIPVLGLMWVWVMLKTKKYQNTNNNNDVTTFGWFSSSSHDSDAGGSSGGD